MIAHTEERLMPDPERMPAVPDTYHNVSADERRASVLGGAAALVGALRLGGIPGLLLGGLGGALLYRGASGHCPINAAMGRNSAYPNAPIHVQTEVFIDRSPAELYNFWRDFRNLPRIMQHLREVQPLPGGRSHWVAALPRGRSLEWDAELTTQIPDDRLGWHSLEGADVPNRGEVRFVPTENGGTRLQLELLYQPPAGAAGRSLGRGLRGAVQAAIKRDLQRLKQTLEQGAMGGAALPRAAPGERATTH